MNNAQMTNSSGTQEEDEAGGLIQKTQTSPQKALSPFTGRKDTALVL